MDRALTNIQESLVLLLTIMSPFTLANFWQGMDIYCNIEDYNVRIDRKGCDSESFEVKACLGVCRSYELPLQHSPYFRTACQLCRTKEIERKMFYLMNCEREEDKVVFIDSALSCSCRTSKCV